MAIQLGYITVLQIVCIPTDFTEPEFQLHRRKLQEHSPLSHPFWNTFTKRPEEAQQFNLTGSWSFCLCEMFSSPRKCV